MIKGVDQTSCCAGGSFCKLGTCLLLAAIAFTNRKHAADAIAAVVGIGCEGKVQTVGTAITDWALQPILIKGHKTVAGVAWRYHALFTAQNLISDTDGNPSDAVCAAPVC